MLWPCCCKRDSVADSLASCFYSVNIILSSRPGSFFSLHQLSRRQAWNWNRTFQVQEVLSSEGARPEGSATFPSHTSPDALVARPNLAECYFTVQRLHCTKVWWERQPLSSCHDGRSSTWSDGGVEQRFLMPLPLCSLNSLSCLSKIGTHFPRSLGKV
jgi:hypothetical protein